MLAWCLHCQGVRFILHYLDDFVILGPPGTQEARCAMEITQQFLSSAGVPIAHNKMEGPATSLTFLGILIDSVRFELRLPTDKLANLTRLVAQWRHRKSCSRKELQSFTCHLVHAAIVIRPGRIFLRSLFSMLAGVRRSHFFIRLNSTVMADFQWWHCFLQEWNGSSFFPAPMPSTHI